MIHIAVKLSTRLSVLTIIATFVVHLYTVTWDAQCVVCDCSSSSSSSNSGSTQDIVYGAAVHHDRVIARIVVVVSVQVTGTNFATLLRE